MKFFFLIVLHAICFTFAFAKINISDAKSSQQVLTVFKEIVNCTVAPTASFYSKGFVTYSGSHYSGDAALQGTRGGKILLQLAGIDDGYNLNEVFTYKFRNLIEFKNLVLNGSLKIKSRGTRHNYSSQYTGTIAASGAITGLIFINLTFSYLPERETYQGLIKFNGRIHKLSGKVTDII